MLYHVYGNDPSAHQGMMGKQNVIYIQGMLFILKVEGNSDICYNMDKLLYPVREQKIKWRRVECT